MSGGDPAQRILALAREAGFELVGIAPAAASEHIDHYRRWLEQGLHGEMTYLGRDDAVLRRADLALTMAEVTSVLVVAEGYLTGPPDEETVGPEQGIIARYARGADYHRRLAKKLRRLLARIREEVLTGVEGRVYVDTGPILERELARRAGLGWFGKNTLLIHPRRGSYFFLGCILIDAPLEPSAPFDAQHCGSCTRCLDACPTGALLGYEENGAPVMDARRCISYLTIEHRGPIAPELRPLMGSRVFGCDICQEVCPFNARFAEVSAEPGYAARGAGELPVGVEALPGEGGSAESHPGTEAPSLVELMRMTREEWDAFSRGSAIRRAGYEGFKRNVAVAMGNWLSGLEGELPEEAVGVLRAALEDESELVRTHAGWALGRAGGSSGS